MEEQLYFMMVRDSGEGIGPNRWCYRLHSRSLCAEVAASAPANLGTAVSKRHTCGAGQCR
eukprot:364675-Chlamydomonas_euryale.AAC.2